MLSLAFLCSSLFYVFLLIPCRAFFPYLVPPRAFFCFLSSHLKFGLFHPPFFFLNVLLPQRFACLPSPFFFPTSHPSLDPTGGVFCLFENTVSFLVLIRPWARSFYADITTFPFSSRWSGQSWLIFPRRFYFFYNLFRVSPSLFPVIPKPLLYDLFDFILLFPILFII